MTFSLTIEVPNSSAAEVVGRIVVAETTGPVTLIADDGVTSRQIITSSSDWTKQQRGELSAAILVEQAVAKMIASKPLRLVVTVDEEADHTRLVAALDSLDLGSFEPYARPTPAPKPSTLMTPAEVARLRANGATID